MESLFLVSSSLHLTETEVLLRGELMSYCDGCKPISNENGTHSKVDIEVGIHYAINPAVLAVFEMKIKK